MTSWSNWFKYNGWLIYYCTREPKSSECHLNDMKMTPKRQANQIDLNMTTESAVLKMTWKWHKNDDWSVNLSIKMTSFGCRENDTKMIQKWHQNDIKMTPKWHQLTWN